MGHRHRHGAGARVPLDLRHRRPADCRLHARCYGIPAGDASGVQTEPVTPAVLSGWLHITVMQIESNALFVRIMNEGSVLGIEGRQAALRAVNNVSLGEKKLGKISANLPGHAGNEGHLAR